MNPHPWRHRLNFQQPAMPVALLEPPPPDMPAAFARPDETLASAIDRYYPRRKGYGWRYQNGVKPGEAKLAQFREVLRLRGTPPLYSQDGKGRDAIAQVKLFDPCGSWRWFISEWDGTDEAFGLICGHEEELGYICLPELALVPGRFRIGIEIDMHWTPRPLRECTAE